MVHSRRLILHIGAHKTGTSTIRRFVAANIKNLRLIGLDYLNAEPPRGDLHTTGNGLPIFLYVERAEAEPKKLESLNNCLPPVSNHPCGLLNHLGMSGILCC